jgi:hypothetical protein
MIKNKPRLIFVLFVAAFTLSGLLFSSVLNAQADSNQLGPYTEIKLPLADLPDLNEGLVYHPVLDVETLSLVEGGQRAYEQSGVNIQVLYVLKDPRDVPIARFATRSDGGVRLPNEKLANKDLITINVYVRVDGPQIREDNDPVATDPILTSDHAELSWPALYVVPLSFEHKGVSAYPCAPVEYADGTFPYKLPAEIDGGDAVGADGLYDPSAYAPPTPWYYSEDPLLRHGDVREGWISCLAPNLPLEQLQVYYRDAFIPETKIVYADEDRLSYEQFPVISDLELIGLTNADLPQTVGECEEMDYCLLDGVADLLPCEYRALEEGLEQGICATGKLEITFVDGQPVVSSEMPDPEAEVTKVRVFYTREYKDLVQQSYLLWNYTVNRSYPVSVIRLDDIPLSFLDDNDNIIKDTGSVVFHDPVIDYVAAGVVETRLGYYGGSYEEPTNAFAFFSRAVIEPDRLTREELEGYRLLGIGAQIDALFEHEGSTLYGTSKDFVFNDYFVQSSDPLEGIIYTSIGQGVEPYNQRSYGPLEPGKAMINIYPLYDEYWSYGSIHGFHPVDVISIFTPSLVSSTDMCDVVECQEVSDPKNEAEPPRTVPVMCLGEWSNNFIIDGVELVPAMYLIGEAWGLGEHSSYIHVDFEGRDENTKVLLYDGRLIGGAAPWWVNSRSYRDALYGRIRGNVLDLETGSYLYNDAYVVHYYERVNQNDLSQGYFTPGGKYGSPGELLFNMGWMGDIVDQKVLIFGSINNQYDSRAEVLTDRNTGFIFQDEGPIWISECSRQVISALTDQELYTQSNVVFASEEEGDEHIMVGLLQGMDYPKYLPVLTGEVVPFREYSDPVSFGNYKISANQIKIIPGKTDVPTVYVESEDRYYPAEEMPNFNNRMFFSRVGAVVIPPDTTLVRVKLSFDYIDNDNDPLSRCSLDYRSFNLAYPGYLPIQGVGDRRHPERWPCDNKDYSNWITFLFPSLDIELDKLQLSVITDARDPWTFMSLSEN